jgi:hypothetical protein
MVDVKRVVPGNNHGKHSTGGSAIIQNEFIKEKLQSHMLFLCRFLQVPMLKYFRKNLNTLLFKTISLTPKRGPGDKGTNVMCLHLEWNEPFATLFENYKKWSLEQEDLEEAYFKQKKKFGGAGNTFLKLFSLPEIRARIIRIKEMLGGEG